MSDGSLLNIPTSRGKKRIVDDYAFASQLVEIQNKMRLPDGTRFKVGSRGWAYQLESMRLINKNQFDKIQSYMTSLRKKGILPVDFVEEDEDRIFSGVEVPSDETPVQYMRGFLDATLTCENWYDPDWWENEEYYIQVLVEKKDVLPIFGPTCRKYHIPIGNAKGWSSIIQRAEFARRFEQAEERSLKPVLLYLGDHDPDGLRISDFLRSNLEDLKKIKWSSGQKGYDPSNLIIDRFGLNYDFITNNNLTWIDNLITGSGKNLASPNHPNYKLDYMQEYLQNYGERKCEANALVVIPKQAIDLLIYAIENYLGHYALNRFANVRNAIIEEIEEFRDRTGLNDAIKEALALIDAEGDDEK